MLYITQSTSSYTSGQTGEEGAMPAGEEEKKGKRAKGRKSPQDKSPHSPLDILQTVDTPPMIFFGSYTITMGSLESVLFYRENVGFLG